MSSSIAKARLGYKNPALRWITSIGLSITGAVGAVVALVDLGTASVIAPVTKVVLSNPEHLRYTYAYPDYPFAAAALDGAMVALSAAVGGIGVARVMKDPDDRGMAIIASPAIALFFSLFVGFTAGLGSHSQRVGGPQDLAWTKAHFSDARVLPSYGMEQKEDGSYKYYPNSVTLTEKDGSKESFAITPLINEAGNVYGIDTKEVPETKAKDIKAHYDAEESD